MKRNSKLIGTISKILVPSDGSKTAKKAAAYAVDLAKQLKASIIIMSVIDQRSLISRMVPASETVMHTIEPLEDSLREAAERYAVEIKKLCDKNGVASKISIKTGHPVEEIVKEAKRSKSNLIVMGSHGRSALSAAVLGSVSYGVIHNDKRIHVLIVRG
jgi:nucleotide-binding universal stress UspA family protein